MRASTFSFDNLERRVLKTGDFFQLQIEVSGGRVEWFKDGVLVPISHRHVDQPGETQLLAPDTYPGQPVGHWHQRDGKPAAMADCFPPNMRKSFLGGRCQVHILFSSPGFTHTPFCRSLMQASIKLKLCHPLVSATLPACVWKLNLDRSGRGIPSGTMEPRWPLLSQRVKVCSVWRKLKSRVRSTVCSPASI